MPNIGFRLCALVSLLFCVSCGNGGKIKAPPAPAPVTVIKAEERVVPLVFETYGLVEPYAQISVKSKLIGKIMKLGFEPGQHLAKGALLVQLDDREYLANLKMFEAQLHKNEILAEDANRILKMKIQLKNSNAIAENELYTQRAIAESAIAALEADKAEVENTKLNIEYCRITAPFDGVAGDILIHSGSIVKANDDTIAKFVQTEPIYVAFALPERMLPSIRDLMKNGEKVEVSVNTPSDKASSPIKGNISFIDNLVDVASGTIKMKASFANEDERLWPGQYVDLVVELSKEERLVAIPTDAIVSGQSGQQLFILKDDATVELRPVETERSFGGYTVVKKGLQAGESVVSTGQFRLAPGSKVSVKVGAEGAPESK